MKESKKRGRPAIPPEKRMINRGVRMLNTQWVKFDLIGGAKWLRKKVDQAKVKGEE